ncbi:VOC family protein [Peteryoungia desertarenae]|uniref:VOC family protein n=1 Tax=Peteryoungia desertarenae TaxID=1813451 RepID=A0ABX6QSP1_9HYPH|nr:VOC family protein [Peteryoungia desertarenae]
MLQDVLEAALYASDIDAAEAFYGEILGLEKISRLDGRHVFFRCGQTIVLIFNATETEKPTHSDTMPVPSHGARGRGHLCFTVHGDDLDAVAKRLADNKVEIEADFCWPNGARSIYFRDPSGNSLECAESKLWNL